MKEMPRNHSADAAGRDQRDRRILMPFARHDAPATPHRTLAAGRWLPRACALAVVLLLAGLATPHVQAAPTKAQIDEAVKRGADYLKKNSAGGLNGTPGLAAYAMVKAGVPHDDPVVVSILDSLVEKVSTGEYVPTAHHVYEASVDLMALEAADPQRYLKEIETIARYILKQQSAAGYWNYPHLRDDGGDTSITQYAILGLWAASRAGVKIPAGVWERSAAWHMRTQLPRGEFTYHPAGDIPTTSYHSMTVNGVASLCVARLLLYPKRDYTLPAVSSAPAGAAGANAKGSKAGAPGAKGAAAAAASTEAAPADQPAKDAPADGTPTGDEAASSDQPSGDAANGDPEAPPKKRRRRFGLLEPVDVGTGKRVVEERTPPPAAAAASNSGRAFVPLADINMAIARGVDWMTQNFTIDKPDGWEVYYLYGLERASALAQLDNYNGRFWYDEGAEYLLRVQDEKHGNFPGRHSPIEGTAFALLFLTNATGKLLGSDGSPRVIIGGGLLIGNRGLPENLSEVTLTADGVQARKMTGPIDELLAELENPKSVKIEAAQVAIVEKIQLGDREALVGQRDRLVKLVESPQVEVRRTALWALGRCSEIDDAPIFLRALEDPDVSVVVEANNALCWLSRRPQGIGLPSDPLQGLPENAAEDVKLTAVRNWRDGLRTRWREWFASVQRYRDREFTPAPRPQ